MVETPSAAAFERALIRGCQREGIAIAKQRGVSTGRTKALGPAAIAEMEVRAAAGEAKAKAAGWDDLGLYAGPAPRSQLSAAVAVPMA